jgi:hypothetical protein
MISPESPSHTVALAGDGPYVHYRSFTSARNSAEMARRLRAAIELGQAHGRNRIMFDTRDTPFEASIGAQYEYAYHQAWQIGLTRDWRVALVISPGDRSYDFMETALINSGYIARLFSNHEQAVVWLCEGT